MDSTVPDGFESISKTELEELRKRSRELEAVKEEIEARKSELGAWLRSATPGSQVRELFEQDRRARERQYHNTLAFRDEMVAQFRAFEIVVNGALMASTHREKDARMRGLLDVVGMGCDRLKEMTRGWYFNYGTWGDGILRADSSVPSMQRDLWEAQQELKKYIETYGKLVVVDAPAEESF